MCRICGGKKTVHGLGYMPVDCICAKTTIEHIIKSELADMVIDKPQKARKNSTKVDQTLSNG